MRLFLAIELSESARRHLIKVQDVLRPIVRGVSFTRPENLHLTLKFLGEVPDNNVKPLCDSLEAMAPCGAVELMADQLTCFPERGAIRIIGAGMQVPASLGQLVSQIETTCKEHGFRLEGRPYTAHITLARAKDVLPPAMRKTLGEATASLWPGPEVLAEEFVLMQSQLKREGAVYTPAAHFVI
ncbi:MAG TPA: RNA 2',3'-cyclic phosphodiesterase [Tepidisphaeraceae bacterium]|nr:RNA 2',3'-cyclic phosphodiesterase [Tepidisphaeraceae bacterium]